MSRLFKNAREMVSNSPQGVGPLGVISNGALVVDDAGLIAWLGREEDVPEAYAGLEQVDLGGGVLYPGLVECHTHLVFAGDRTQDYADRCSGVSYEEVAARGGGIRLTVRETRRASKDELLRLGRARLSEFLKLGVTTVEIKSGYGLSFTDELKCLEVAAELAREGPVRVIATALGAHVIPDEYADRRDDYVDMLIEQLLPEIARRRLASFVDVFCETGAYTLEESDRILRSAKALGFGLKIHSEQLSRTGATTLAAKLGAVSADHLEHIEAEDIAAMKSNGTVAVLLPGAGLFLGARHRPPARALLDAGVPVALSTDYNPGTCPSVHLPMMATLGCSWLGMSPDEAIRGITIHAAKALGLTDGRGTLAVGSPADFAMHDVDSWAEVPYLFGQRTARRVWIAGNRVV